MAWSLVQAVANQAVATTTVSLPSASTAGNLLICTTTSGSSTAITGPSGWTPVISKAGTSSEVYIWANFNNPGAITTFTAAGGTGSFILDIAEFTCTGVSGVTAASDTGSSTAGATTTLTTTSGGTALAGDLSIVAAMQHVSAASTITWTDPSGYTRLCTLGVASSTNHHYAAYELALGSGGAQSVTFTSSLTGAAGGWTGVIATFSQPSTATAKPGVLISQYTGFF